MRLHRGQAMVEVVIITVVVLLPLFLAMPLLGKYLDMRTAAVESARYAAWERTVWYGGSAASSLGWGASANRWNANAKTDDRIRSEVAVRILSNTGETDSFASIDKDGGGFKTSARSLWRTHDGQEMLASYDDVENPFSNNNAPGAINEVLGPLADLAATLGPFTLEMKGEYGANVKMTVRNTDLASFWPQEAGAAPTSLTFSESNLLLANGWNAGGPDSGFTSVKRQVQGLTPTSVFDSSVMGINVGDTITTILSLVFPEFGKLKLGKIEPDEVPEDRLK